MSDRAVDRLAELILGRRSIGFLRVGVDGIDASGKTIMADALAERLRLEGLPVLRSSIDGFHNPASTRRSGSYYDSSFNYAELRKVLLDPLVSGENCLVRTQVFDYRTDSPVEELPVVVEPGTVLVFDGIFLLRPELVDYWDLSVHLRVSFETSLQRALERDLEHVGDAQVIEERYRMRYFPGQEHYLSIACPERRAGVLIDNNDPLRPRILRMPSP